MVASNARKNFGFLHISFYKVVQIVLPIIFTNKSIFNPSKFLGSDQFSPNLFFVANDQ